MKFKKVLQIVSFILVLFSLSAFISVLALADDAFLTFEATESPDGLIISNIIPTKYSNDFIVTIIESDTDEEPTEPETSADDELVFFAEKIAQKNEREIEKEKLAKEEAWNNVLSTGQAVVDYAFKFVDSLPYVWGGASLESGADCCGFTWALYQHFGIDITRLVETQANIGYSVPIEEAIPGDIIIYSGHVALYAGDGMKIHAPSPGQYVTYDSAFNMPILDVRRVL